MAKQYSGVPAMQIDTDKAYRATIATTRGDIVIDLDPKNAPVTVNNFVTLARDGFYDGVTFHRVIPNFMIQGGDPTATGSGGPGYQFDDETKENPNRHERGVISMANAGTRMGKGTNGSQFFITHDPQPHLDGKHTVFGRVTTGQDVVDAIRQGDAMDSVTIEEM